MVVVPLLLALAVWAFARELFGEPAALLAVFLLLSEPNVIGNSTLVQDDLAAALAVFVFVILLRSYLKRPSARQAISLGFVIGLALLIKHSLIDIIPISFIALVAHLGWQRFKHQTPACRLALLTLLVLLCAYLVLIAGYAFHTDWIDEDEAQMIADWLHVSGGFSESLQALLMHLPIQLPKYFLYGMEQVVTDVRGGRPAFLFGQVSAQGWWYYFPVAFVLKASLPFLLVTLAGLVWLVKEIIKKKWADGLWLIIPPLFYLAMSMTSHLDIGVRHVLAIWPFFAVIAAGAITTMSRSLRWREWKLAPLVPAAIAVWCAVVVLTVYPDYMTSFNPLAGGAANGWKRLSDSNVETGQEVKALADYLKQHNANDVTGAFMGSEFIKFYGIELRELEDVANEEDDESRPAYVAIGAWYLQEVNVTPEQKAMIDPYRTLAPEAMVGHSIFVFRTSTQPTTGYRREQGRRLAAGRRSQSL
jgi:4-amino-4-deoxy-L-arabinose transferase-like glycosyltransferase